MRGSSAREPRLDPVRWRRPGRSALFRWAAVAALVATAAVVMWSGPGSCEPSCPAEPAAQSSPSTATVPVGDLPGGSDSAGGLPGNGGPLGSGDSAGGARGGGDSAGIPRDGAGAPGRPVVPAGSVGVPIRPAEPTALKLLRPGDRVDVFSVPDPGDSPQAIATAALVLSVTGEDDPVTGGLLLALTPAEARLTVRTPPGGYAVLLRPG